MFTIRQTILWVLPKSYMGLANSFSKKKLFLEELPLWPELSTISRTIWLTERNR